MFHALRRHITYVTVTLQLHVSTNPALETKRDILFQNLSICLLSYIRNVYNDTPGKVVTCK